MRKQEQELLDIVKRIDSRALPILAELREEEPEEYMGVMYDLWESMEECREISGEDPKAGELCREILKSEVRIMTTVALFHRAELREDKDRLKKELREQLTRAFELRMKEGAMELEYLSGELEELKQNLAKRKELAKEIVERRLKEELGEDDLLEW